jgi:hypothetical protein
MNPARSDAAGDVKLQYAPRRSGVRRRWKRVAIGLALLLPLGAGWWWRNDIKAYFATANLLRAQERCLEFDPGPDRVAYEENPARAQALLAQPEYLPAKVDVQGAITAAVWWPRVVREFPDATRFFSGKSNMGLLFLHERVTPGGRKVLVCAMVHPDPALTGGRSFGLRAVDPATRRRLPETAGGLWTVFPELDPYVDGRPLRVYAGRPDPADPSHFTIEYEARGKRGVLDGWVLDEPTTSNSGLPVTLKLDFRPDGPRL